MPTVNLVGPARQDGDNKQAGGGRLVNYYRERIGERFILKAVPGMSSFVDLAGDGNGQAMLTVGGTLYAMASNALFSVTSAGAATNRGSVAASSNPTLAGYDANVMIESGGKYYVWDGSTLSQVTGGAFTDVGSVCYVQGYTVLTELDGDRFEWTALRDPGTRAPANVARAEASDDNIIQGLEHNGNLVIFGERSTELWGLTGQANANAFAKLPGATVNKGLLAKGLVTKADQALALVANDGVPYLMTGVQMQPIGNVAVNTAIFEETPTNLFYYEYEGHKFIVIRFASRPSWVFDLAMNEWHERAQGNDLGAWSVRAAETAYGKQYFIGDSGGISQATGFQDLGETLLRKAVGETLEMEGRRFTVPMVEVRGKQGFSSVTTTGVFLPILDENDEAILDENDQEILDVTASDGTAGPKVMMRVSRDRGVTWTAPKELQFGDLGDYANLARKRSLGQARTFTMELSQSTNADLPLFSDVIVHVV